MVFLNIQRGRIAIARNRVVVTLWFRHASLSNREISSRMRSRPRLVSICFLINLKLKTMYNLNIVFSSLFCCGALHKIANFPIPLVSLLCILYASSFKLLLLVAPNVNTKVVSSYNLEVFGLDTCTKSLNMFWPRLLASPYVESCKFWPVVSKVTTGPENYILFSIETPERDASTSKESRSSLGLGLDLVLVLVLVLNWSWSWSCLGRDFKLQSVETSKPTFGVPLPLGRMTKTILSKS